MRDYYPKNQKCKLDNNKSVFHSRVRSPCHCTPSNTNTAKTVTEDLCYTDSGKREQHSRAIYLPIELAI